MISIVPRLKIVNIIQLVLSTRDQKFLVIQTKSPLYRVEPFSRFNWNYITENLQNNVKIEVLKIDKPFNA